MKLMRSIPLLAALLGLAACRGYIHVTPEPGRVIVHVERGETVRLEGSTMSGGRVVVSTYADATGIARFRDVPLGHYTLTVCARRKSFSLGVDALSFGATMTCPPGWTGSPPRKSLPSSSSTSRPS